MQNSFYFVFCIIVGTNETCPITIAESYPLSIAKLDPYDAIEVHKSRVVLNASNQGIYIDRNSGIILRDLFKMLKRGQLDIKKVPDVTFIKEEGIDAEGLTKEFFTLVMDALTVVLEVICLKDKVMTWYQLSVKSFIRVATSNMWVS